MLNFIEEYNSDMSDSGLDFLCVKEDRNRRVSENVHDIKSAFEDLRNLGEDRVILELQEWLMGV